MRGRFHLIPLLDAEPVAEHDGGRDYRPDRGDRYNPLQHDAAALPGSPGSGTSAPKARWPPT
jgi:hypothetical protein